MSIGVPVPSGVDTFPSAPYPSADARVAPDATQMRAALYDARRESFRARGAALRNRVIGGFAPVMLGGAVYLQAGVVQLMVPLTEWTTGGTPKLYVPEPLGSNETGVDGAYRAERATSTAVAVGNGTTGPLNSTDSIVYLAYDSNADDRITVRYATVAAAAALNWASAVPVAWVRAAGGSITLVRDLRPMPAWLPRVAQVVYDPPITIPYASTTFLALNGGSYWLTEGQAVMATMGVQFLGVNTIPVAVIAVANMSLSRGDAADGFAQQHFWYGGDEADTSAPVSISSMPLVGGTFMYSQELFLPRVQSPTAMPGVYHFNGIGVRRNNGAAEIYDNENPRSTGQLRVSRAYLKLEHLAWAQPSDVEATSAPESPQQLA